VSIVVNIEQAVYGIELGGSVEPHDWFHAQSICSVVIISNMAYKWRFADCWAVERGKADVELETSISLTVLFRSQLSR
jgi:hypothetical protein